MGLPSLALTVARRHSLGAADELTAWLLGGWRQDLRRNSELIISPADLVCSTGAAESFMDAFSSAVLVLEMVLDHLTDY